MHEKLAQWVEAKITRATKELFRLGSASLKIHHYWELVPRWYWNAVATCPYDGWCQCHRWSNNILLQRLPLRELVFTLPSWRLSAKVPWMSIHGADQFHLFSVSVTFLTFLRRVIRSKNINWYWTIKTEWCLNFKNGILRYKLINQHA